MLDNNPVTIYLDGRSRKEIDSIAQELGLSKSAAIRLVMREKFLAMFPVAHSENQWSRKV
jgi:antitoxin component of RelBE/YafQ-DinJ toxin-antitoxin module